MFRRFSASLLISGSLIVFPAQGQNQPARLKAAVADVLRRDAENLPSSEGIMFVGGSTVAGWDLRRYFPQYRTVNRGVEGALISDATFYADQLIAPLKPSTIVFYSGDSDAVNAAGVARAGVELGKFLGKVHQLLPKSQIVVVSVRPGAANAAALQLVHEANEKFKAVAEADKQARFVDANEVLINPDGKPALDLLGNDRKILSSDGYSLVSQMVRGAIKGAEERYWRGYNPPKGQ